LALGAAFDTHFQFRPIIDDKPDKPIILIGPPGAGKTLCVAKFATKATMGKRPVTVISTDVRTRRRHGTTGGLYTLAESEILSKSKTLTR